MANRPEKSTDKNLEALDYKPPNNADLARYIAGLNAVDREFEYLPRDNDILDDYFRQHRGVDPEIIDLTSSGTNLPPYEPAMRAAASAAEAKDAEMHGRVRLLHAETEEAGRKGEYFEDISHRLFKLRPRDLDEAPTDVILQLLTKILSTMTPEVIEVVKKAYEKGRGLHPVVNACIEHCSDRDYAPRLPRDRSAIRAVKESAVDFIVMACNEHLDGKLTKKEGLKAQFARLQREFTEEEKRIPKGDQLTQQAAEINEKTLKPEIIKMMGHLQGINPCAIKPENLSLCGGSSTHIMEVALEKLVTSPKKRWLGRGDRKKLLLFSMSWDGLKGFADEAHMENSLIDGSVNAQALEDHIKWHILQGKYANDPDKAKAEVKKQVGALVMNIPENPIGKIPSDEEMQALAKVIEKYDLPVVVVDEVFAAPRYRSLMTYPGMAEHCYVISSTSKNINAPNRFAFGYSANDAFAKHVKDGLHQDKQLHPIQAVAFSELLGETPPSYFEGNQEQYARKRRLVSKTIASVNRHLKLENGIGWLEEPNYGCLGVVSISRELTDACNIKNSCQLAEYIYKLSGVQTLPNGDVKPNSSRALGVRINFSEEDHTLIEAIERIGIAMQYMQQKKSYKEIKGDNYRGEPTHGVASGMLGAIVDTFRKAVGERGDRGDEHGS